MTHVLPLERIKSPLEKISPLRTIKSLLERIKSPWNPPFPICPIPPPPPICDFVAISHTLRTHKLFRHLAGELNHPLEQESGEERSFDFISRQMCSGECRVCQRPAETRAAHATEPAQGARKAREFLWGKHLARNPVPLLWAGDSWGSFTSRQHKGM